MATNQYIQLPADSTGKRVRCYQRTIDSTDVTESIVVINPNLGREIVGKYMISTPIMNGVTTNPYYWFAIWNPSGSGIYIALKRVRLLTWTAATAVYIPMEFNRISGTAPSGGTQITSFVKKDTSLDGTASAVVRYGGVTIGTLEALFNVVLTAGAAGQNPYLGAELLFQPGEEIILRETEGISIRQNGAGDTDQRHVVVIEWDEFTGIVRP